MIAADHHGWFRFLGSLDGLPPERIRWETVQGVEWLDRLHEVHEKRLDELGVHKRDRLALIARVLDVTPQAVRNYLTQHDKWREQRRRRNGKRPKPYPAEADLVSLRGIWQRLPVNPATGRRQVIRNGTPEFTEIHDEMFKLTAAGFDHAYIAIALKLRRREVDRFLADPLPIKHIQQVVREHRQIGQDE